MRRTLALLASTATVLALVPGAGLPAASAVDPLTGRIVDSSSGSVVGAANMTVQLREVTGSGPGDVVASTVTDADGAFSLDAGPSPDDEYYVRVFDSSLHQGGWVGGEGAAGPDWVQPTVGSATTYGPHANLGLVYALPAFVRGQVVNPDTGNPVRGVTVRMIDGGEGGTLQGSDVTNRRGYFRITGLSGEDNFGLRLVGEDRGYENGWRDCNASVTATWGEACASPLGRIGKVRLDKLP